MTSKLEFRHYEGDHDVVLSVKPAGKDRFFPTTIKPGERHQFQWSPGTEVKLEEGEAVKKDDVS